MTTSLLSLPNLEIDAICKNFFSFVENLFEKNNVPWENCIAFWAENTLIMLGKHTDISTLLKNKNPNMIIHDCACHLVLPNVFEKELF